jgi:MFS family permease
LPRAVWVLGGVSLFMDMSSELIHAVLPIYLTTVLGLSVAAVGVIEGVAEATASMTKLVSGALSDRYARRKPLTLAGYGLAALTKPLFPLAESALGIVVARFADRVGKGLRGAPRDAIVADVTTPEQRDAAYGLRQSLDTVGAFLGPLLAMALLVAWPGHLRAVLWVATVPAVIAVALLAFGLREPGRAPARRQAAPRLEWRALRAFSGGFWPLIAIAAFFAVARLSEAFLVLRAQELRVALPLIPLVMIVMSTAYALSSYPSGLMGGAAARPARLALGLALLLAGYAALAFWSHPAGPVARRRAVRAAHGPHAGHAVGGHCRCGACRAARHRLRHVPLRHRRVPARGLGGGRAGCGRATARPPASRWGWREQRWRWRPSGATPRPPAARRRGIRDDSDATEDSR